MRFRFKPTPEQRAALRDQLSRLQQPEVLLAVLADRLPRSVEPGGICVTVERVHSDRFVLRVRVSSRIAAPREYAVKVYSDDFCRRVWAHAQRLADYQQPDRDGLCLPTHYLPQARMLVFPWVGGVPLSDVVCRRPDLLRRAAALAADLHRMPVVPEHHTTVQMIVEEARARCDRLRLRVPETRQIIDPLMTTVEEAATLLDPAEPAPVHGDMAAGQFLWTGDRLVLLDLDMFGYADPAYDVGHFLAQLERRCSFDPGLPAHAARWLPCFRDAYFAAMPLVSPRNAAFYRGLTLVRKIYTICRREPNAWPELAPRLASGARAALRELTSSELLA